MCFSSTPVGKASSQRKCSPDCKVGKSLGYSRKTLIMKQTFFVRVLLVFMTPFPFCTLTISICALRDVGCVEGEMGTGHSW